MSGEGAEFRELIIIGSGPAGCTAALYSARAGYNPLVLHGEVPGGQLTTTTDVENFPSFKGTGPDLVKAMEEQATNAGAEFIYAVVVEVDLHAQPKRLKCDDDKVYECNALIIATGANARYLGLENEKRLMNKGVSGCATCDGPLFKGKDVCVVGGGDTACEEAMFLSHICKSVKLIHRRDELRASLPMKNRVEESNIEMIWSAVVIDVLGDNEVTGLRLKSTHNDDEWEIPTNGLFIAIGHIPATDVFKDSLPRDDQGYLLVKNGSTATEIEGVFAAGDCADKVFRQAVTSAGKGCEAALLAERYLQTLKK